MARWRRLEWWVVGVICLTAVAAGVTGGLGAGAVGAPTQVGDGTANVTVTSLPSERIHLDRGRFGTNVTYLRVPDARVRVTDVRGTSRLLYRVQLPALDIDAVSRTYITTGDDGAHTLRGPTQGIEFRSVPEPRYDATVTIRVQSFEIDKTVVRVNATVEVEG